MSCDCLMGQTDDLLVGRIHQQKDPETNSKFAPEQIASWETIRLPFGAKGLFVGKRLIF